MKKLVVLLSLVATVSAFSQGQVNFVTKNSTVGAVVDAPITYGAGGPMTVGAKPQSTVSVAAGGLIFGGINARAALYAGAAGTAEDQLRIITPSVPFRSTAAAAGYVNPNFATGESATREVPGVLAGANATFQIRAWDTGLAPATTGMSYEDAVTIINAQGAGYYGKGNVFTVATGGGSVAPTYLTPATGFAINYVPEPSIIGLGILGAVAGLVAFRRRN